MRAPEVKLPGHSAHFMLLTLTSAGRDTGNFDFEKENLFRHLHFYREILPERFQLPVPVIRIKIYQTGQQENRRAIAVLEFLKTKSLFGILDSGFKWQILFHFSLKFSP